MPAAITSKLRILHVIPSMAAEAGGPPVVCAGLAGALAARGHEEAVATVDDPGLTPLPLHPEVRLHAFPIDGYARYAVSRALEEWLDEHVAEFDIVHLHSVFLHPTFAAAKACWRERKPYVVLLNGMLDVYSVHQRSAWLKRVYWLVREGRIAGRSKALHCLNHAEIRRAVPWIRNLPKFILSNGIDEGQLAALPARGGFRAALPELGDKPLVLFLSRLHPKKGLERLIPTWKRVAEKVPEARLLIAGAGEDAYVTGLKNLTKDNGLERQVLFLGQIVGTQKWQALVDADIFVLPSHQEGFSMAITEALAAGCPPVVTEECNYDELAPAAPEPACGVIIRNGDMNAFADAIVALLHSPEKRQTLATAGTNLVAQRYTWQKVAADLELVYRHILAGKPLETDGADVWRRE